jgi:hypothetical protein
MGQEYNTCNSVDKVPTRVDKRSTSMNKAMSISCIQRNNVPNGPRERSETKPSRGELSRTPADSRGLPGKGQLEKDVEFTVR